MICLMYHRLASREDYEKTLGTERIFTLPVDEFEKQIKNLVSNNYTFVTPEQTVAFVSNELELPEKSVLITFDDGCLSVKQYAIDILSRYNACATLFVATDPNSRVFKSLGPAHCRISDDELRQIDGDIINIESHTVTHRPLRSLNVDEIRFELMQSKNDLENIVSRKILYLAIPGNCYNRSVMKFASEAGYKAVWYSNPGIIKVGSNLFGLPRLNIEGQMTLSEFMNSITARGIMQRQIISMIKRGPLHLLGPKYWLPLRKIIMRFIPGGYLSRRRIIKTLIFLTVLLVLIVIAFSLRIIK